MKAVTAFARKNITTQSMQSISVIVLGVVNRYPRW